VVDATGVTKIIRVKAEVEIGVEDNEVGVEYGKVDFEVDGKLRVLGAEVGSCRDGPVGGSPRVWILLDDRSLTPGSPILPLV